MIQAARVTKEMMDRGLNGGDILKFACNQIYADNQVSTELHEVKFCSMDLLKYCSVLSRNFLILNLALLPF